LVEHHLHSEFYNLAQEQVDRQISGLKAAFVGYIQRYNPISHTVIIQNPLAGDVPVAGLAAAFGLTGNTGMPLITGEIQLSTGMSAIGNGNPINNDLPNYGIQLAPFGGANPEDNLDGEQVLVVILNNESGYSICAYLLFNDQAKPPGNSIPITNVPLKPGEWLWVHASGTTMHWDLQGNINIYLQQPPNATANMSANLNVVSAGGIGLATTPPNTAPILPHQGDINTSSNRDTNASAARDFNESSTRDTTVNAGRNIQIGAAVNITISALGVINIISPTAINIGQSAAFLTLLTEAFLAAFNSHTHIAPSGGGLTTEPTVTIVPVAPITTSILAAN